MTDFVRGDSLVEQMRHLVAHGGIPLDEIGRLISMAPTTLEGFIAARHTISIHQASQVAALFKARLTKPIVEEAS